MSGLEKITLMMLFYNRLRNLQSKLIQTLSYPKMSSTRPTKSGIERCSNILSRVSSECYYQALHCSQRSQRRLTSVLPRLAALYIIHPIATIAVRQRKQQPMMPPPSIAASAVRGVVHCHIHHHSTLPSSPPSAIVITDATAASATAVVLR